MSESFTGAVKVSSNSGGNSLITLNGNTGDIRVRNAAARLVFRFNAEFALLDLGGQTREGDLRIRNRDDQVTIRLDGDKGDIRLIGADLAEEFACHTEIEPGSVLVAVGPDEVDVARTSCDRRVMGVASGAGDFRPGLRLGTRPGENRIPVAVVGRAYCKVDAAHGAIALGDLLTTSTTEGHAMRAADPVAAAGAIIGKALGGLEHGRGLIPILLALR
jgi:hypothetical protein